MRIALIGSTGRIGRHLAREALARGHAVTALTRERVDILDADALARESGGHDVLVSAYGAPSEAELGGLARVAKAAAGAARIAGLRQLLVIGGAGVLELSPGGLRLGDSPGFPSALRPKVDAHAAAIEVLRAEHGLAWTCMVPAAAIAEGPRTARYRSLPGTLVRKPDGASTISYADFACAVVDALERGGPQGVVGVGD